MAEYPSEHERALKRYISTFRCQVCRCSYQDEHVRVAARHDQLWVVSVRCRRCRNQQLFYFAPTDHDPDAAVRDVTDEEEARFLEMDAVSCDEVLDMHQFLQRFNGDFKALFTR